MEIRVFALTRLTALSLIVAGCQPVEHEAVFQSRAPKASAADVQVYFDDGPPIRPYQVVGRFELRSIASLPHEYAKLIVTARTRAAAIGADAIIVRRREIEATEIVDSGDKHHHERLIRTTRPAISATAIVWIAVH